MRISIWPGGNESGNQFEFRIVQVECLTVKRPIHLRVGEEYLGRAALGDDLQHAGFLKLFDGLCGENHCGVMLSPCLLGGHDVAADGLVLNEEPCFVHQEHLERRKLFRIGNFVRRPVQDVEEEWLEHLGRVAHPAKLNV